MALLNYNRALLTNEARSVNVPLTDSDTKILEFGLFVPQANNFVELLTNIGWIVPNPFETRQPTIVLTIKQDGTEIGSARQESVVDGEDSFLDMVTMFQTVLTNVPVGHHVYELFARNNLTGEGDIEITGPANISGKVIG